MQRCEFAILFLQRPTPLLRSRHRCRLGRREFDARRWAGRTDRERCALCRRWTSTPSTGSCTASDPSSSASAESRRGRRQTATSTPPPLPPATALRRRRPSADHDASSWARSRRTSRIPPAAVAAWRRYSGGRSGRRESFSANADRGSSWVGDPTGATTPQRNYCRRGERSNVTERPGCCRTNEPDASSSAESHAVQWRHCYVTEGTWPRRPTSRRGGLHVTTTSSFRCVLLRYVVYAIYHSVSATYVAWNVCKTIT